MATRVYFTLFSKAPGEYWCQEFGDYDRAVVTQELRDQKEANRDGYGQVAGTQYKIIEHDDAVGALANAQVTLNSFYCEG